LGRSSISISQIDWTHSVANTTMWTNTAPPSSGAAHAGALRFFAAAKFFPKLPAALARSFGVPGERYGSTAADAFAEPFTGSSSRMNGVVLSSSSLIGMVFGCSFEAISRRPFQPSPPWQTGMGLG
jgi:hypothetical protein